MNGLTKYCVRGIFSLLYSAPIWIGKTSSVHPEVVRTQEYYKFFNYFLSGHLHRTSAKQHFELDFRKNLRHTTERVFQNFARPLISGMPRVFQWKVMQYPDTQIIRKIFLRPNPTD